MSPRHVSSSASVICNLSLFNSEIVTYLQIISKSTSRRDANSAIMVEILLMGRVKVGNKKRKVAGGVSAYANLANKRRVKKDARARKKAEYLATLPKHRAEIGRASCRERV